jgi:ribonuclease VapC
MVLDTSVFLALLNREPEADDFAAAIEEAESILVSASTYVEAGIVVTRRFGEKGRAFLDEIIMNAGIQITPVTPTQARLAVDAFAKYGKGQGHPAQLNFGDCFAYALAKESDRPLLFKGEDFAKTDLRLFRPK